MPTLEAAKAANAKVGLMALTVSREGEGDRLLTLHNSRLTFGVSKSLTAGRLALTYVGDG